MSEQTTLQSLLDGKHWLFLCFTTDRAERLQTMLAELIVEHDLKLPIGRDSIPAGVLWNGEACEFFAVPKDKLPASWLLPALRSSFGYERPEITSDLFTLGVTPEDDERLERVGLFGKN